MTLGKLVTTEEKKNNNHKNAFSALQLLLSSIHPSIYASSPKLTAFISFEQLYNQVVTSIENNVFFHANKKKKKRRTMGWKMV